MIEYIIFTTLVILGISAIIYYIRFTSNSDPKYWNNWHTREMYYVKAVLENRIHYDKIFKYAEERIVDATDYKEKHLGSTVIALDTLQTFKLTSINPVNWVYTPEMDPKFD